MLISPAPIAIPVNTANIPTESVSAEAAQRPKIPQPPSAPESSSSKNTTEFSEQAKSQFEASLKAEQEKRIAEKEQSDQQNNDPETEQEKAETIEARKLEEIESEEQQVVQQLQKRDREVKAHEQAHASAGGSLAGAANLNFVTGPDGRRYASSGEVSIDVSRVANDPEATVRKLEQVQRAALAPTNPSSQDLKVAAQAAVSINQARNEINLSRFDESQQSIKDREFDNESEEENEVVSTGQSSAALKANNEQSLSSTQDPINPVAARRQAAQLNQKIAGSGALDLIAQGSQISITA